jgi:hypothetical protein
MIALRKYHGLPGRRRKRALFSYLAAPVSWKWQDPQLGGHSNKWESREIARLIARRGYEITAIDWSDRESSPPGPFDCLFDIHGNLPRLAAQFPGARKLLHLTGSYNPFQHEAENARIEAFESRRGVTYPPRRHVSDLDSYLEALSIADACSLIGNECTLSTYPAEVREKITPVTVSASWPLPIKSSRDYAPPEREFLWFAGGGCILKGLDLTVEAFAAHAELVLHVVGNIDEREFLDSYRQELASPNIVQHGYLDPSGSEFREIVDRCFAFVAPSASEGISPAAASCMLIGLYPIVSRNTGITLPAGAGTYLDSCSIPEIEAAAENVSEMTSNDVRESIALTQAEAKRRYSRNAFSDRISAFLENALRTERGND